MLSIFLKQVSWFVMSYRPLSGHVDRIFSREVFFLSLSAVFSILHRVSGLFLVFFFFGFSFLSFVYKFSYCSYFIFYWLFFFYFVLFVVLFFFFYHFLNGLRHIIWDLYVVLLRNTEEFLLSFLLVSCSSFCLSFLVLFCSNLLIITFIKCVVLFHLLEEFLEGLILLDFSFFIYFIVLIVLCIFNVIYNFLVRLGLILFGCLLCFFFVLSDWSFIFFFFGFFTRFWFWLFFYNVPITYVLDPLVSLIKRSNITFFFCCEHFFVWLLQRSSVVFILLFFFCYKQFFFFFSGFYLFSLVDFGLFLFFFVILHGYVGILNILDDYFPERVMFLFFNCCFFFIFSFCFFSFLSFDFCIFIFFFSFFFFLSYILFLLLKTMLTWYAFC